MTTEVLFGLSRAAVDKIRSVFSAHPQIEKAILYGSRAKGNYRSGSDIDLTLLGADLDLNLLLQIMGELDDLLLPWTVDLSIHGQIDNPSLLEHIDRVGVTFYPPQALS